MLYNYGMIFLYKSFFVNYILSFSLVRLWTIRLLVQVHRHWVHFTLACGGYDNHNCLNKSQIWNEAGVWMTSCSEGMIWEFGYFEKHVIWVLDCRRVELVVYWGTFQSSFTVGQSNWVLEWGQSSWGLTLARSRVESELRPWCWEVEVWPWSSTDLYRQRS